MSELVERVAIRICRQGLCRGMCHSARCEIAREQHGDEARTAIAEVLDWLEQNPEIAVRDFIFPANKRSVLDHLPLALLNYRKEALDQ